MPSHDKTSLSSSVDVTTSQTANDWPNRSHSQHPGGLRFNSEIASGDNDDIHQCVLFSEVVNRHRSEKRLISGGLPALVEPDIYLATDERKSSHF